MKKKVSILLSTIALLLFPVSNVLAKLIPLKKKLYLMIFCLTATKRKQISDFPMKFHLPGQKMSWIIIFIIIRKMAYCT